MFYDKLNLDARRRGYQPPNGDDKSCRYLLYAVVAHAGDAAGGHHHVYVRPNQDHKWLRCHDDKVAWVTKKEAIDSQWGAQERVATL